MKKIMILGAGRGQIGLIEASKRLGYYTIVVSIAGNYPGLEIADEVQLIDITDADAVYQKAVELKIDGIATSCLDTGIETLGYVCDRMKLSGLTEYSARISNDKMLMKEAFNKFGIQTPRYCRIQNVSDLRAACDTLKFPVIIKAVDLQGSRGIYIINSIDELLENYKKVKCEAKKDYCIIEEFIEGMEFGAQAFVQNGKILYILPTGNVTYRSSTNIPIGHYVPLFVSSDIIEQIHQQCMLAIKTIGFDNCAVNFDMIEKNGKVYILELTGRLGANCLPEIQSTYFNMDIYELIARTAVGDYSKFSLRFSKQMCIYAQMLKCNESGILQKLNNTNIPDEHIIDLSFWVQPGDKICAFSNSKDCIGQLVVKDTSMNRCKNKIQAICKNINFVLNRNDLDLKE